MSISSIIHAMLYVHPPHTLVVHFPIALVSVAFFFLLLAIFWKADLMEKIAFANMCLAALSTLVAMVLGMRDNLVFYHGMATHHVTKIALAVTLFVVTTATVIVRWRNPKVFFGRGKYYYLAAYVVSFGIVAVLGFLGGVIIFGT